MARWRGPCIKSRRPRARLRRSGHRAYSLCPCLRGADGGVDRHRGWPGFGIASRSPCRVDRIARRRLPCAKRVSLLSYAPPASTLAAVRLRMSGRWGRPPLACRTTLASHACWRFQKALAIYAAKGLGERPQGRRPARTLSARCGSPSATAPRPEGYWPGPRPVRERPIPPLVCESGRHRLPGAFAHSIFSPSALMTGVQNTMSFSRRRRNFSGVVSGLASKPDSISCCW
jgi:hypothetical protein